MELTHWNFIMAIGISIIFLTKNWIRLIRAFFINGHDVSAFSQMDKAVSLTIAIIYNTLSYAVCYTTILIKIMLVAGVWTTLSFSLSFLYFCFFLSFFFYVKIKQNCAWKSKKNKKHRANTHTSFIFFAECFRIDSMNLTTHHLNPNILKSYSSNIPLRLLLPSN